ncbi:hypothetical protein [Sodalis glossinidius]|uniref:hypothetical protein n=1 Tax=Sodalis glossinidius TaxID=63612 RepID=UPI0011D08A55|nr:hypothetical protein [Sodalis glossinidius]
MANSKIGNEYGKVGSIYRNDFGYYVLMKEGHPVAEHWDYPARGQSNHFWQFLTERAGTFSDAKHFGDPGKVGDVYFSHVEGRYYIAKKIVFQRCMIGLCLRRKKITNIGSMPVNIKARLRIQKMSMNMAR